MAETKARFLANTIGATSASNDFTLPNGVGTDKQILQTDGAGGTAWVTSLTAPTISSVTGTLNVYEDGVSEDGGVLTINGTEFGSNASVLSVQISGTTGFGTVAETTAISLSTPGSVITATFTGAETNYNHSSLSAGSTIYVKVTKSGLQTATYATLGTAMTGDPSFSTTSTTSSTHTGTLASTSLGSYGGQIEGGGDDSNTKLLLNFDRTGGTDIEDSSNSGGDGHKITATNAVIKASPFGDGKSAIYFSGSSDKLVIDDHADFTIGANDFTFEFWINLSSVQNWKLIAGLGMPESGNTTALTLGTDSGGNIEVEWNDSGFPEHILEGYQANRWYHIAISRQTSGGTTTSKAFIDGVGKDITIPGTLNNPTGGMNFGSGSGDYTGHFNGYLDEIRFVNGTGVYRNDFDVPSSRLTAITNTKLLIHSNKVVDSSGSNNPIITFPSQGKPEIYDNSNGNFGTSALVFSGTDCKISIDNDWDLDGDFCIDFRARRSGDSYDTYLMTNDFSGSWWGIYDYNGDNGTSARHFSFVSSDTNAHYIHGSDPLTNLTWHHVAVTRSGSTMRMFVDGTQIHSWTSGTGTLSGSNLKIGGYGTGTTDVFNGGMQEIRIVKGEAVFPTDGSNFTPSDYPYGHSSATHEASTASNVKLLIHGDGASFTDSATSGTTHDITPTGAYHSQAHGGIVTAMTFPSSLKQTGSAGLFFNGTNSYAEVNNSGLTLGTTFTIEMWVYFLTKQDSALYHHRYDSSNDNLIWYDESASSLIIDTDETPRVTFTFNPSTHRWYHVALSVNNSTATLYVDGSSVGLATGDATLTGGFPAINATIRIGNRHHGDRYFHGYLDGYRIQQGVAQTFTAPPTKIYGAYRSQDVGTIQLNATAGTGGGALDYAELSGGTALSTYGLSLSSSGAITGTLTGLNSNSNSGGVIRIRARANADDNRLTTLGGSSFTGITQNGNTAPVLFNARRYIGTSAVRDINGYGFQPDLVWFKTRSQSYHHALFDSVRGTARFLESDRNVSENTANTNTLTAFNADGFESGADSTWYLNKADEKYIAWGWKAGGAPSSSALSLTNGVGAGTIANDHSDVSNVEAITQSVNQNSGFSITQYTGTSQSDVSASFPHNLGGNVDFIIIKNTYYSGGTWNNNHWLVWHKNLANPYNSNNNHILLNEATSQGAHTGMTSKNFFPATQSESNTIIKLGHANHGATCYDGLRYICYAWKAVPGVSAFGSYTGPQSSTVSCGFKPRMVIIRCINTTEYWLMFDQFRETTDTFGNYLFANASNSESSGTGITVTVTDNGFTTGTASGVGLGTQEYIFMAFA